MYEPRSMTRTLEVDFSVREAAMAVGMSPARRLVREINQPLAQLERTSGDDTS